PWSDKLRILASSLTSREWFRERRQNRERYLQGSRQISEAHARQRHAVIDAEDAGKDDKRSDSKQPGYCSRMRSPKASAVSSFSSQARQRHRRDQQANEALRIYPSCHHFN